MRLIRKKVVMDDPENGMAEPVRYVPRPRRRWWLLSLPVVGGLLGWFGMMMIAYVTPAKFESMSVVQILDSAPVVNPFGGAMAPEGVEQRSGWEATQMEVLMQAMVEMMFMGNSDADDDAPKRDTQWRQPYRTSLK